MTKLLGPTRPLSATQVCPLKNWPLIFPGHTWTYVLNISTALCWQKPCGKDWLSCRTDTQASNMCSKASTNKAEDSSSTLKEPRTGWLEGGIAQLAASSFQAQAAPGLNLGAHKTFQRNLEVGEYKTAHAVL